MKGLLLTESLKKIVYAVSQLVLLCFCLGYPNTDTDEHYLYKTSLRLALDY